MIQQSLIPSVSLEAVVSARDRLLEAFVTTARSFQAVRDSMPDLGPTFRVPTLEISTPDGHRDRLEGLLDTEHGGRELDHLRVTLDRSFWSALLAMSGVDQIMASRRREEMHNSLRGTPSRWKDADYGLPPLTVENIRATFEGIALKAGDTFSECVESVFKRLSWDYRRNQPYRLGCKMIVSGAVRGWDTRASSTRLWDSDSMPDLERALHVIAKRPQPSGQNGLRVGTFPFGQWVDVPSSQGEPLLRVKCYRNRNVHLEIFDQAHVDELNRIMAARQPFAIGEKTA